MKNQQLTIMLLGGARRVSLAQLLKRSGSRIGYKINIVSYDLTEEIPISLEGKVIKGLKWSDPGVVDDIERVVKEYGVNVILPFVNGAIEIASQCKDRMKDVFVPVTDFEISSALFDKAEAAKVFKESGLPTPRTYSVLSAEIPAIAKPRKGGVFEGYTYFQKYGRSYASAGSSEISPSGIS